jgi:DNA-binding GntR family transcriptional regulator
MEKYKSLKDHVYDYIAKQILDGTLEPEQKINENVICEELNISRTPVREALIQLASEGVLKNRARKGFVVRALSEAEVAELYGVLGVLDGYAAEQALEHLSEKDLANMEFYVDSMDVAIRAGNYEMYHVQQVAFHDVYIQKAGNRMLIDEIERLKSKLIKKKYVEDEAGRIKKALYQTNEEHRVILQFFREKNAPALREYLENVHWSQKYAEIDAGT